MLKWLTKKESEATKVIMSAKAENGFEAWQMLSQAFEPYLASRQGSLMADFSGMAAKLAKAPKDTRVLMTELERKMRVIEDITGVTISDDHTKSVLVGLLDPVTRTQIAARHGQNIKFAELNATVLEFVTRVGGPEPMQFDRFDGGDGGHAGEPGELDSKAWDHYGDGDDDGGLKALGRNAQRFTCQGVRAYFKRLSQQRQRGG